MKKILFLIVAVLTLTGAASAAGTSKTDQSGSTVQASGSMGMWAN